MSKIPKIQPSIYKNSGIFSIYIPSNVKNIPEFLTYVEYFGVSVRFLVSFAKFLDIRNQGKYTGLVSTVESRTMSKYWESRKAEIFCQTHGLNWHNTISFGDEGAKIRSLQELPG